MRDLYTIESNPGVRLIGKAPEFLYGGTPRKESEGDTLLVFWCFARPIGRRNSARELTFSGCSALLFPSSARAR